MTHRAFSLLNQSCSAPQPLLVRVDLLFASGVTDVVHTWQGVYVYVYLSHTGVAQETGERNRKTWMTSAEYITQKLNSRPHEAVAPRKPPAMENGALQLSLSQAPLGLSLGF